MTTTPPAAPTMTFDEALTQAVDVWKAEQRAAGVDAADLAGWRIDAAARHVGALLAGEEGAGGAWEVWGAPYGDAAAKRRSVAPVASERGAGGPSLTVHAAGGLVGGVPRR